MIIITDHSGRLGNKLHLFAHFIAFSIEHDVPIMFPGFAPYRHLFTITRNNVLCQVPPPTEEIGALSAFAVPPILSFARLPIVPRLVPLTSHIYAYTKNTYCDLSRIDMSQSVRRRRFSFVHGYFFRHYAAVQQHATRIREILSPLPEYRETARGFVSTIRDGADALIGVHIRHGDYVNWQEGRHFFALEQYLSIMRSLEDLFKTKRLAYVIASDATWTVDDFPGLNVAIADHEPIVAMQILSLCDYMIGPKSSFNRWASFFGNVPLYTIRDPEAEISRSSFEVNFLDDLTAILQD